MPVYIIDGENPESDESPPTVAKGYYANFSPCEMKPYLSGNCPTSPTEAQIDDILRPIRPEALRTCAHNTGAEAGCWLRLCYTNEEGHESLWSANESAEWVTYEGVVLDDESIFGGLDLAATLEIYPERIANERVDLELKEQSLREAVEYAEEGQLDDNPLER
ncbi:hypothetical protein N7509_007751 [Penicillium cosmopolitanum]|uniref:Uncharacterized protein n=1 Tax=Penicillium cosmopolitanum TaxID=1131564 RepID=A0A9W9VZT1_9EURO|nr:uncharacterized protein N7509_007751 [Penicillium cosmopolitanum]KAJ5392261.1 hypothetical protein N7509_007751 [Penicillium cosmopolitanum]